MELFCFEELKERSSEGGQWLDTEATVHFAADAVEIKYKNWTVLRVTPDDEYMFLPQGWGHLNRFDVWPAVGRDPCYTVGVNNVEGLTETKLWAGLGYPHLSQASKVLAPLRPGARFMSAQDAHKNRLDPSRSMTSPWVWFLGVYKTPAPLVKEIVYDVTDEFLLRLRRVLQNMYRQVRGVLSFMDAPGKEKMSIAAGGRELLAAIGGNTALSQRAVVMALNHEWSLHGRAGDAQLVKGTVTSFVSATVLTTAMDCARQLGMRTSEEVPLRELRGYIEERDLERRLRNCR